MIMDDPSMAGSGVRLQEAINLRELLDTSVTTFTVAPPDSDDELDGGKTNFLQDSTVFDKINLSAVDMSDDGDPSLSPFQRLGSKMLNVTDCGKVRKQVLRAGEGPVVPENATVVVHYNAFIEHFDEPYDSTYLRGKPDKFRLSCEMMIQGLEIGLKTMHKREKASFLIHPDMAYGDLGCPPRIPPSAELLFEVELLNFLEDPGVLPIEEDSKQEKTFDDYYKAAQIYNLQGNDEFLRGNTKAATAKYRQATSIMERVRMENQEQEDRYKKLLFRLYTNMAVCYNKECKPYKVLDICKRAHAITDDKRGKLLYHQGKALVTIGDFQPALRCLNKAKKLAPNDEAISKEIRKLDKLKKQFSEDERERIARSFGFEAPKPAGNQVRSSEKITEAFSGSVRSLLEELKNSKKTSVTLPKGLTSEEECFFDKEAKKMGLTLVKKNMGGQKTVSIVKNTPDS